MSEGRHVAFVVEAAEAGVRLDRFLAERLTGLSRTQLTQQIDHGDLLVNGAPVKPSQKVRAGDRIHGSIQLPPSLKAAPENVDLNIVYVDECIVVIDKPAGIVVHPSTGHTGGTIANALLYRFPETSGVGEETRPGIVHRLDKDTSGLLVAALTSDAQHALQRQFAARTAHREYTALASGIVRPPNGAIDAPIGRDPRERLRMAVHGVAARRARSIYRVEEYIHDYSLLTVTLETGRTHQIRVHMSALGHPLAGDALYGGPKLEGLSRQFLHAARLTLTSPRTGEEMTFSSPLPPDLAQTLGQLKHDATGV